MQLTFVDFQDIEGSIGPDWTIEYDGPSVDAIEAVVDDLKTDDAATSRELQDLSVALFSECSLKRIECLEEQNERS